MHVCNSSYTRFYSFIISIIGNLYQKWFPIYDKNKRYIFYIISNVNWMLNEQSKIEHNSFQTLNILIFKYNIKSVFINIMNYETIDSTEWTFPIGW